MVFPLSASVWTIHGAVLGPEKALARRKSGETRNGAERALQAAGVPFYAGRRDVCAMKKKQKARGLIPGRHDYTTPARTAEDDRCLLNWLSTTVTADGLDCDPDS